MKSVWILIPNSGTGLVLVNLKLKQSKTVGPVCSKAGTVNANPGLKDIRGNNFSSTEMFFTAYVLYCLRLIKLKSEGKTI